MTVFSRLIVSATLLASPALVSAAAFTNGSFEAVTGGLNPANGTFTTAGTGSTAITGWIVTDGNVDIVNTTFFSPDFVASNGVNSIDLNGDRPGTIAQTFSTMAGQDYHVSFDLNSNSYGGDPLKSVGVSAGEVSNVFNYDSAVLHHAGAGGPWVSHSFNFTALGSLSTLTFKSLTSGCCWGAELDNVVVSSAVVPEPASWALMLTGFGLVGAAMRRRSAKVAFA